MLCRCANITSSILVNIDYFHRWTDSFVWCWDVLAFWRNSVSPDTCAWYVQLEVQRRWHYGWAVSACMVQSASIPAMVFDDFAIPRTTAWSQGEDKSALNVWCQMKFDSKLLKRYQMTYDFNSMTLENKKQIICQSSSDGYTFLMTTSHPSKVSEYELNKASFIILFESISASQDFRLHAKWRHLRQVSQALEAPNSHTCSGICKRIEITRKQWEL